MNRKMVLILPLILLTQAILAIDPPGIMWTRAYYEGENSGFYHVIEAADGGFVLAGYQQDAWGQPSENCLFKTDANGNLLWNTGLGWYSQYATWVEMLDDGGCIATGSGKMLSTSTYSLFILRAAADGDILWTRNYDFLNSAETGYCVIPVPGGGFVACGGINVTTGLDHAWILRTDADGDTLWTRQWGGYTLNDATKVIYLDGLLHVLTYGRIDPDSAKGVHLVTWDLEGNLLDEVRIPELTGQGMDMCYCPWDGGYTIVTKGTISREIAHVDCQGNLLWRVATSSDGYSISTTMDGDYIYGGQKIIFGSDSEYRGRVVLFGPDGDQLWEDWIYELNCMAIYSIRQLSQGGYIAAGIAMVPGENNYAQLIRYEPETGIDEGITPQNNSSLAAPVPNPSAGGFSISFSLSTDGPANLAVYDLAGRRVTELYEGIAAIGEHSLAWDTGDLPSGCYIVMLRTDEGVESSNCVLIR
jgi:hypothetical protein